MSFCSSGDVVDRGIVNINVINVPFFGIIDINALKIAEKALAALGAFSTILRALISIIPQNVTLIPY